MFKFLPYSYNSFQIITTARVKIFFLFRLNFHHTAFLFTQSKQTNFSKIGIIKYVHVLYDGKVSLPAVNENSFTHDAYIILELPICILCKEYMRINQSCIHGYEIIVLFPNLNVDKMLITRHDWSNII